MAEQNLHKLIRGELNRDTKINDNMDTLASMNSDTLDLIGKISQLTTDEKDNLVKALNEVKSKTTDLGSQLNEIVTDLDGIISEYNKEPTVFNIMFEEGYQTTYLNASKYRKKNGFVYISMEVKKTDNSPFAKNINIDLATLPVGFRGETNLNFVAQVSNNTAPCQIIIKSDGTMMLSINASVVSVDATVIRLNATYHAGGGTV